MLKIGMILMIHSSVESYAYHAHAVDSLEKGVHNHLPRPAARTGEQCK